MLIKNIWLNISDLGLHPSLNKRDIRVTRIINKLAFVIIALVLVSFVFQTFQHLYNSGRILPHSLGMLANFLPLSIVFYLNKKRHYYYARLVFILLPMISNILWMFVGSSQSGLIHFTYLVFPIPIVILFDSRRTQIILVILSYVSFLISQYIIVAFPANVDSYSNPYFSIIIVGIFISLSFVMLLFFVSEMDKAEDKLQQTNEELEEFSKIASHDMKEPLRTISSFASLIKKKHREEIPEEVSNYLEFIETGATRLNNLLADLTNYSTIESSEEELKDVDLNTILANVKDDLKLKLAESGALIKYDSLPTIRARASHISQLFQNLIQNSIKFQSPEKGGVPEIIIDCRIENNYYHIAFQDNGIGIQQEYLEDVFLKFSRLHNKDTYEGTGLGLATCKRIVEQYNGDINISSTFGEGTTVTLKFIVTS